jgi:hypothetical protein
MKLEEYPLHNISTDFRRQAIPMNGNTIYSKDKYPTKYDQGFKRIEKEFIL